MTSPRRAGSQVPCASPWTSSVDGAIGLGGAQLVDDGARDLGEIGRRPRQRQVAVDAQLA